MALLCGHTTPQPHCRLCYLAVTDAKYAAILSQASPHAPGAAACRSRGTPLVPSVQMRLGLGLLRQWHPCAQGHGTIVEGQAYVCACRGQCGPSCPDYQAAPETTD